MVEAENGAQRRNGQIAEKRQQNQWQKQPICAACVAPVCCKVEAAISLEMSGGQRSCNECGAANVCEILYVLDLTLS